MHEILHVCEQQQPPAVAQLERPPLELQELMQRKATLVNRSVAPEKEKQRAGSPFSDHDSFLGGNFPYLQSTALGDPRLR